MNDVRVYVRQSTVFINHVGDVDHNGLDNITFSAGDVRVMFNVSITDDDILEMVEKFNLTISSTSLLIRIFIGDIYQSTVLITDNDGKCQLK